MARTRIRNAKLDEISFVGKGDNPEAHVLLLKMKKDGDDESNIKDKGEDEMPLVKMTKERDDALVKVADLEKEKGVLTEEVAMLKADATCPECGAPMKKGVCEKGCGKKDVKKEDGEDPIYKGLPEAVITKMKADSARIEKMEDDNLNREYISKAAAVELVGPATEIGPLLKTIAKTDPATADKVLALFKTADARIKEGDLLKEKGTGGGDGAVTALDKINKKRDEYKTIHPEVSLEKAFTIVFDAPENAELRKQYNTER